MDTLYREIILEHWKNPQNYGTLSNPDFEIEDFNPLCGDIVWLTGRVKDNKLIELKFTSEGCAISKASASILTEIVSGLRISEVKKMTSDEFLKHLEITLTPARLKCALLSYSALQKTIKKLQ